MSRPFAESLEWFAAERADFQRLLAALEHARTAPLGQMRELAWVHEYVCSVGLAHLHPVDESFGDQAHLANASHQGVAQYPLEFARWLHLLGGEQVRSYLEIGCFNGYTACLAAAYLRRFEPGFHLVTLDLWPWFLFESEVRDLVPVEYRLGHNSCTVRGQQFDAVFIDGDHSFEWTWADYQNVGRAARLCGLHDIASVHYYETNDLGGVVGAWQVLQRHEGGPGIDFREFCDHPAGDRFGIGVRRRQQLATA